MDFEDFKLKPLSEGLGFHKKKVDLDSEVKKAGFVDKKLALSMPDSESNPFGTKEDYMDQDLPDNLPGIGKAGVGVKNRPGRYVPALKNPLIQFDTTTEESKQPTAEETNKVVEVKSCHSLVALLFDFFIVSGLFLTASVALFVVTDLNTSVFSTNIMSDPMTQGMMAVLFVSISMFYLVLSRSVTFCTLGEWAVDMKLGYTKHRSSMFYPIRVFFRCLVMTITGVLPITLLSIIRRKDCLSSIIPIVKVKD